MKEQGTIRLADRVLAHGIAVAPHLKSPDLQALGRVFQQKVEGAIQIDVQEVAEYYWSERTKELWSLKNDFPNVALPYELMFMEFSTASIKLAANSVIKRNGAIIEGSQISYDEIVSLSQLPAMPERRFIELLRSHADRSLKRGELHEDNAPFWIMQCHWITEAHDGRVVYVGTLSVIANKHGIPVHDELSVIFCGDIANVSNGDRQHLIDAISHGVNPALLALSFMHCRNIRLKPQEPPSQLSKSFQRRHGRPLVRYHILEIAPMKQVLATEGNISHNGFKKALHLCRGHFAHYTPERGFLGRKLEEPITIWKPAHVRGSLSEGAVVKDYAVKTPA